MGTANPFGTSAAAAKRGVERVPGPIPIVFDGQGVAPPQFEAAICEGYVGKCTP